MVQIKQKRGTGVQNPSPRSLWCGHTGSPQRVCSQNYGEPKMGCTKEFVRQTREKQKWIKKPSNQKGRSAVVVLFLNVQVLASSVWGVDMTIVVTSWCIWRWHIAVRCWVFGDSVTICATCGSGLQWVAVGCSGLQWVTACFVQVHNFITNYWHDSLW